MRNLLQTLPLLFTQISFEGYRTFDPVHISFVVVRAFLAIDRVNPPLTQAHYDALERPTLSLRIQRDGHRDATAKCGEEQRVRTWSRIFTAHLGRLVGKKLVIDSIANFVLQVWDS